jgi:hypothetical protein
MNVNSYLGKVYSYPPCWEMVADIYVKELGLRLLNYNPDNFSTRAVAEAFRLALYKGEHNFKKVEAPMDFDVVLLGASSKLGLHHCGVFYQGRILHSIDSGNLFEEISTIKDKYPLIEFWRYSK